MQIGIQQDPYRDPNNINRSHEWDNIFKTPTIIDISHHEIHEGGAFIFCDVVSLGSGASQDILITTPNTTKWTHFGYDIYFNDGAGTITFFEATDKTGTTPQTVVNKNRNSGTVNTTTVHYGTTGGTTDGTIICYRRAGSGKTLDGIVGSGSEKILKQNTKYIIRITNATTSINNVSFALDWYEHTSE